MSEPVSNAEVEDVLASIRRLVSNEKRPKSEVDPDNVPSGAEETNADAVTKEVSRLVLTPSQRVDEHAADADWENVAEHDETADGEKPDALTLSADDVAPENAPEDAEPENTSAEADEEDVTSLLSELPGVDDEPVAATFEFRHHGSSAAQSDDADEDEATTEPSDTNAGTESAAPSAEETSANEDLSPQPSTTPTGLGEKIAALEAVIGRKSDTWEPDGVDADPYSGTSEPAMDWASEETTVSGNVVLAEEEAPAAKAAPEEDARGVQEDDLTASEEAADASQEDPEVAEGDPANVASPETTDSSVSDEPVAGPSEAVENVAVADNYDADAEFAFVDQEVIDEDALRDMVAEIVRQELQGALGERITRNVRKLVRREIHRALTTQELD